MAKTHYNSIVVSFCLAVLLATAVPARAEEVTLIDKNSNLIVDPASSLGALSWTVDGQDHMSQQWLWIRLNEDTEESSIDTLTLAGATATDADSDPGDETLTLEFTGTGFTISYELVLEGSEIGSATAQLNKLITITNTGGEVLDFELFEMDDLDIIGLFDDNTIEFNSGGDTALITSPTDGSAEITVSPRPSRFQAGTYNDLIDELIDANITTLTNVAGPLNGDVAAAFQWSFRLDPNASFTITKTILIDADLIIDNTDPRASQIGDWFVSTRSGFFGEDSMFSIDPNGSFNFEVPLSGRYRVSLWWTQSSLRSTEVPVTIRDGDSLLDTVIVDQRHDGGRWNPLGVYFFNEIPNVQINPTGSGTTSADAVMFTAWPPWDFNADGITNLAEFDELASFWLQSEPSLDIAPLPNGDDIIDEQDLEVLIRHWLESIDQ